MSRARKKKNQLKRRIGVFCRRVIFLSMVFILAVTCVKAVKKNFTSPFSASKDKEVQAILDSSGEYPDELIELLENNRETVEFVSNYPNRGDYTASSIDIKGDYTQGEIPLFLQWDLRWGYLDYGDSIVALDGCGPTCLSMAIVGLTGDTSKNPKAVADFSAEKGWYKEGTDWDLMTKGAKYYGLSSKELPLWETTLIQELNRGNVVICSMGPGDFTTSGHFVVIHAYKEGKFWVKDPNSVIRSEKGWTYEELQPQIKNLWSLSKM